METINSDCSIKLSHSDRLSSIPNDLTLKQGNDVNLHCDFADIDHITIITSNGEVTAKLSSKVLENEFSSDEITKTIEVEPSDLLEQVLYSSLKSSPFRREQKAPNVYNDCHLVNNLQNIKTNENIFLTAKSTTDTRLLMGEENNLMSDYSSKNPNVFIQSVHNTAVEQPLFGPSSCFICGNILGDPNSRYSYLQSQNLLGMSMPLLQILSYVINQTVMTNAEAIDLCLKCSKLMNDVDITLKHLKDLRKEINNLFKQNRKPKLTFHMLSKSAQSPIPQKKCDKVDWAELASSRPRTGRVLRNKSCLFNGENKEKIIPMKVNKKLGRPCKPFQCQICKLKFSSRYLVDKHKAQAHSEDKNVTNLLVKKDKLPNDFNSNTASDLVSEDRKNNENSNKNEILSELISHLESRSQISKLSNFHSTLESLRRIQPKPNTSMHTSEDGSVVVFMNPVELQSSPMLLSVSPGFFSHKTQNYECEYCGKFFTEKKGYLTHKVAVHGVKSKVENFDDLNNGKFWNCENCTDKFKSKKELVDHFANFHGEISYTDLFSKKQNELNCPECDQTFDFKYQLESHQDIHLSFKQLSLNEFICCLCGLKVSSKAAFKYHYNHFHCKSESSNKFLCDECGYLAATKKSLIVHSRVHSEQNMLKKKKCPICLKEVMQSSFKVHMLRMHGDANYACDKCNQTFTVRSDLLKHVNSVHSTFRPYDCHACGQKFVTSNSLRYHKSKVHSSIVHSCDECGKFYKWKGELRNHRIRCHSNKYSRHRCSLCSKSYTDRKKFLQHMSIKHKVVTNSQDINFQKSRSEMESDGVSMPTYADQLSESTLESTPMVALSCMSASQSDISLVRAESELDAALQSYGAIELQNLANLDSHISLPLNTPEQLHRPFSQPDSVLTNFPGAALQVASSQDLLDTHESLTSTLSSLQVKSVDPNDLGAICLVSDIPTTLCDKQSFSSQL